MAGSSGSDDEILQAIKAGVEAERGYADFETWPDRPVKELGLGRDFAKAVSRELGISLSGLRNSPANCDPPDLISDVAIGIELTELVDQAFVEQAVVMKRAGTRAHLYREWDGGDLRRKLLEIIASKDAASPKAAEDLREYYLVIHTDEPGLTPDSITTFLADWQAPVCNLIDRAFLLLSYFPAHGGRPVYELSVKQG